MSPLRSELLVVGELTPVDVGAWEELAAHAITPNPFAEPDFVLAAARGLGAADVGLLVVRDGVGWAAALPVRRVSSWRRVPGRCVAGWRHQYSFLGTPLLAEGDLEATASELVVGGLKQAVGIALDWIDADGPLAGPLSAALSSRARLVEVETFERAALKRRGSYAELEQRMSSHHRRELRRTRRRLEEEIGSIGVRDRSGEHAAYAQFLALEQGGWKGRAGTAMACDPGHAAFFVELCDRFAGAGRLQLLALGSEQRTVAMKCNLIAGGAVFCFKIAFDEQFAALSPGIHLEVANMRCFDQGEWSWSDSCADPGNAMINRLWPQRRRLRSVVVTRRGPSGALPYLEWRAAAVALARRRQAQS